MYYYNVRKDFVLLQNLQIASCIINRLCLFYKSEYDSSISIDIYGL